MEVDSAFVTGANSGIGLGFVRHLVELPEPPRFVFASYRTLDTAKELIEIRDAAKKSKVVLIKMDVTNADDIASARSTIESYVGDGGLTLLVNNAGANQVLPFPDVTEENMLYHFKTNTVGPLMVFKEMLPLLKKAAAKKTEGLSVSRAAVLNISSMAGSIRQVPSLPQSWNVVIGYRTSKAALNMAMRVTAMQVKDQGVLVVQMCPGYVKTRMTDSGAEIEVADSVASMIKTLASLDETHQGEFMDRNGNAIPF